MNFNLDEFISNRITKRNFSLFKSDLDLNADKIKDRVCAKSVLVIGGAGTIGLNFIKALLIFHPAKLVVVDKNENALTELTRDLRSSYDIVVPKEYKTYPIDFGDSSFYQLITNIGPFDIVANFAAHKHVRSEKDNFSTIEILKNNILNNIKLVNFLNQFPPSHFFCVSTDKASNPVNIMGASKRIMELVIFNNFNSFPVTSARFANVAFSNGSLLDGFINRILNRQPISAPNDVKRYFVSPKESGELCLLACVLGKSNQIFYPKLEIKSMLTFSEICDDFLKYLGYTPYHSSSENQAKLLSSNLFKPDKYPVYYFKSNTTGEKLYEEFYTENEKVNEDLYNSVGVIDVSQITSKNEINELFEQLNKLISHTPDKNEIILLIKKYINNFSHVEKNKNLDEKM